MSFKEDNTSFEAVALAVAAGLGIGFGLGILFAPRSGVKTRAAVSRRLGDSIDQVRQHVEDIGDSATGLMDKGKRAINDHKEAISQGLGEAKKAMRESWG